MSKNLGIVLYHTLSLSGILITIIPKSKSFSSNNEISHKNEVHNFDVWLITLKSQRHLEDAFLPNLPIKDNLPDDNQLLAI